MNSRMPKGVERPTMEADIVCVGFGPATAGFLTELSRGMVTPEGTAIFESRVSPGLPLQVICYERADDIAYGVSGVVTRGRALKESFPQMDFSKIPLYSPVTQEKVLYLLDPIGASCRSTTLKVVDRLLGLFSGLVKDHAMALPYIPPFLNKKGGFVLSLGQFNQWAGSQLMASGLVQVWPGVPVVEALIEENRVAGVRLADQGVDKMGNPGPSFTPGMDLKADLTVVGDGSVGQVGRQLDRHFGLPQGHHQTDWALGMKVTLELPKNCALKPGVVIHTLGYPEPEIFGFLYVYPDHTAAAGIFVPSWFDNPMRTSYRYLQHWMRHPALWKYLNGAAIRSWGAKSLQESGRQGEPFLVGNGYARIGEGSGSTNILTGSGVDEAWATGVQLADGVLDILKNKQTFTQVDLELTYLKRRRESWVQREALMAERARDGFRKGFSRGLIGMALAGISGGAFTWPARPVSPANRIPTLEDYYRGRISPAELDEIRKNCEVTGQGLRDALMEKVGWPLPDLDGLLLVSHQDALLVGGKVQAAPGFKDHVVIMKPELCSLCNRKVCVEMCSGQALRVVEEGRIAFDREKCVHCGACIWNCSQVFDSLTGQTNLDFRAGSGGLHSAEN